MGSSSRGPWRARAGRVQCATCVAWSNMCSALVSYPRGYARPCCGDSRRHHGPSRWFVFVALARACRRVRRGLVVRVRLRGFVVVARVRVRRTARRHSGSSRWLGFVAASCAASSFVPLVRVHHTFVAASSSSRWFVADRFVFMALTRRAAASSSRSLARRRVGSSRGFVVALVRRRRASSSRRLIALVVLARHVARRRHLGSSRWIDVEKRQRRSRRCRFCLTAFWGARAQCSRSAF